MSSPDLTDAERQAVLEVLNTPILSMGQRILDFEQAICELTGSQHAVGVSSGTAGLHLCVRTAGIGRGDLVLTTPFSFVASANVMLYEGAVPIFVDVNPRTGNIDPELVQQAARDLAEAGEKAQRWLPRRGVERSAGFGRKGNLKAILPVDVFGQPADLDPIRQVADQFKLKVIEDACEALGAEYKGRPAGTCGDLGIFAFYPNKQITTGEGGVVITNDQTSADMLRALRNQGRAPGDTWLEHTLLGYNYRLDEMSAALGKIQMTRLDELLDKRERVAGWYNERLAEIPDVEPPAVEPFTSRVSWFVYVVHLAAQLDRDKLAKRLKEDGVAVRPYFVPIHLQPYMKERFGYLEGDFPVTEDLGRRGLALPFSSVMSEKQVDYVCRSIRDILSTI